MSKRINPNSGGAPAAKKPHAVKRVQTPAVPPGKVFDLKSSLDEIKAFFEEHGYAVIQCLTKSECKKLIEEQIREILLKQPLRDQFRLQVFDPNTGKKLDIDADTDRYIEVLTSANLDAEVRKRYSECWTLHKGFGACCDPQVFHLRLVWAVRQNPRLYQIAMRILGNAELWVDINRSIQKLPEMGEHEFAHWDMPYFFVDAGKPLASLSGKVCYTKSVFRFTPGTHSKAAQQQIKSFYQPLYPGAKPTDAKFGLSPKIDDPLRLVQRCVAMEIDAGCAVFWHPMLLHGVEKNPKHCAIQFGHYQGYMLAVDRPEYHALAARSELEDRIHSYTVGCAPELYPSLDEIHYYPARHRIYHNRLKEYIETKMDPTHPSITTRVTRKGDIIPHLVPIPDPAYTPPELSALGQKLLGIRKWRQ